MGNANLYTHDGKDAAWYETCLPHAAPSLLLLARGSLISLSLYRRRLLALLDPLFESYLGVSPRSIVALSGEAKSTLLLCGMLLPLAVTNLRASIPEKIAASDASGWGEAAVVGSIPRSLGKELIRHGLRKSVWAKLLAPADAWMKSHDLLGEEEELPGEGCYRSNPLFELCAEAPHYKLLFASAKKGQRHINIGELRAALRVERLLGEQTPSSRLLLGADSQVALGTLIKGRATSKALNQELVRSIPWMLGLDVYLECLYFHTKLNRGDDPTRGKDIRPPTRCWPEWIAEIEAGDFGGFDRWLAEHGLDDISVADLPPFSELLGNTGVAKEVGPTSGRCEADKPLSAKVSPGPAAPLITPAGGACQSDRCCPKVGVVRDADGSGEATAEFPGFDLGPGPFRGRPTLRMQVVMDPYEGALNFRSPVLMLKMKCSPPRRTPSSQKQPLQPSLNFLGRCLLCLLERPGRLNNQGS